jgi:quercetin dioxygenase-like cupin family protein
MTVKSLAQTVLVAALATLAQAGAAAAQHHEMVSGDAIKWGPAPPSLPPGALAAILMGNPAKEGPFVLRLKFPDGFVIPPHRHSKEEHVTVLAGGFAMGTGEKIDRDAAKPLPPGSFIRIPTEMPHWAWAKGETIVQINGMGPFDVRYVNPGDDPRLKKTQ